MHQATTILKKNEYLAFFNAMTSGEEIWIVESTKSYG